MSQSSPALSPTQRLATCLASLGGLGRFPIASGTVGSAVTVAAYLLLPLHAGIQLGVIACVIALGLWSSSVAAAHLEDEDPSLVIIDEVAGMLIGCFLLPKRPLALGLAFVVFRIFDIGKWFPMKQLERLPGGWGIMADDLAAGLLTRIALLLWR